MSHRIINGSWLVFPSGGWSIDTCDVMKYISDKSIATEIHARSDVSHQNISAQFQLDQINIQNLNDTQEIRFWLKSSRIGDGNNGRPFYLYFVVTNNADTVKWERLIPVKKSNHWELYRFWLDNNFPDELKNGNIKFRLCSLDPEIVFSATIGDFIATKPQVLQDVELALMSRLNNRFEILHRNQKTLVPAIVNLPENPGSPTIPYISIIPWAVKPQRERGGSVEIVDNFTLNGEAYVRPCPWDIQMEYSVDVYVSDRIQKTQLLEFIINDFISQPYLVVNGEPLSLISFSPTSEETAESVSPGRSPLFYQMTASMERAERRCTFVAKPFVVVGHYDDQSLYETMSP